MKLKAVTFMLISILLVTLSSGFQPKITEVSDNFGNTWEFEPSEDETTARATSDKEIIVNDQTEITLCISEVQKEDEDEIDFHFNSLQESIVGDHPDDSIWGDNSENCNTWNMQETDYQPSWGYRLKIRNQDEIHLHNQRSDFRVDVSYTNLIRENTESSNIQNYNFDSVELTTSEYDDLKSKEEELENKENQVSDLQKTLEEKNEVISNQNEEIEEKNELISNLTKTVEDKNESIQNLDDELEEKNSRIVDLESKLNNYKDGISGAIVSFFN